MGVSGGKIETEEAEFDALRRELKEELDINVSVAEKVLQFSHKYPEELIVFSVWYVRDFNGNATGKEGQKIAWVSCEKLKEYSFPVANTSILKDGSVKTSNKIMRELLINAIVLINLL